MNPLPVHCPHCWNDVGEHGCGCLTLLKRPRYARMLIAATLAIGELQAAYRQDLRESLLLSTLCIVPWFATYVAFRALHPAACWSVRRWPLVTVR